MDELFLSNPKNFQILEHKKFFVEQMDDWKHEIETTICAIAQDSKNYHAWSYRIWLCKRFDLFEQERLQVEQYITDDVGNNSAWSYRYFLYTYKLDNQDKSGVDNFKQGIIANHVNYCVEKLKLWGKNEAAWNYLKGF